MSLTDEQIERGRVSQALAGVIDGSGMWIRGYLAGLAQREPIDPQRLAEAMAWFHRGDPGVWSLEAEAKAVAQRYADLGRTCPVCGARGIHTYISGDFPDHSFDGTFPLGGVSR